MMNEELCIADILIAIMTMYDFIYGIHLIISRAY
jgi:hypothetical protein